MIELRPGITANELKTRATAFAIASDDEKRQLIAQILNSVLPAREAVFLIDMDGLLTDDGAFEPEIDAVVSSFDARPHPPVVFIARRMIPRRLRRTQDDVSYLALRSLDRESSIRLLSRLLKDRDIATNDEQLDALANLADGHPYNFYRMMDEIAERGLEPFLANPGDFIEWKHRQSSEYLSKISLGNDEFLGF